MPNLNTTQCRSCIAKGVCGAQYRGGDCYKFGKTLEAVKTSHNTASAEIAAELDEYAQGFMESCVAVTGNQMREWARRLRT